MRRWHTPIALTLFLGAAFASTTGCELIAAPDRSLIPDGSGLTAQGGAGGSGGDSTTTGGGQGGTAGQGGQGGTNLETGEPCGTASQCQSGFCVDGVCCETACNATCQACSATAKGAGEDGTCGNAAAGQDPHNDCENEDQTTCGRDGTCNGDGACRLFQAGTSCGATAGCDSGEQTFPDQCDGDGQCVIGGTLLCGSYTCDSTGMSCLTTCTAIEDCAAGNYCNSSNECATQRPQGQPCTGGIEGECTTGYCVDGYCCNSACDGECRACSNTKKGSGPNGTCGNVLTNTDPDTECNGYTCSGGACRTTCSGSAQCAVDYTCTSNACVPN
ncbi:hypothetical protein [Chondromyces crocatus]|uniref:PE-PGRS family protein n=1 Tax=Chondromyces crocatus TaxID=52 RepID=A0A0K1E958_CHOCO|nr:hypothetical protein [Chondromyces crocatus]AKT37389.1 uncharacterized protein CMC5_015250 [Chondromyces crocatus]